MEMRRYLKGPISEDLKAKMVFMAGPRQVGKTILAKRILSCAESGAYYLWDNKDDRRRIIKAKWPAEGGLIVLDELHKYRYWKRFIKGEYDKYREKFKFLVTGSARLDIYRRGGDSLQGRYHHYRLHPFTLNEVEGRMPAIEPHGPLDFNADPRPEIIEQMMKFGGFPEPFIAQSERAFRRWKKERFERFFREDVRDLESLRDFASIQILADMIPERVSSTLSLNSLREDLEVSHKAVKHWIEILEKLYFIFRLRPFFSRKIRGLKKGAKPYLWDWTSVKDESARYENLVASHLLKFCHFIEDYEGYKIELWYLRDVDKREVDFLVTIDSKPWFAVECKLANINVAKPLIYFGDRLKIPYLFQVVLKTKEDFVYKNVRVINAPKFLSGLM